MTRRITVRSGAVPRRVTPPAAAAFIAIETTYLVAASNARPDIIAVADFVCDGTDDEVQINDAVTALGALGLTTGRVQLSEGVFNCTAPVFMVEHLLQGSGRLATELIFDNGAEYVTGNGAIDVGRGGIFDLEVTVQTTAAPTPLSAIFLDELSVMHNVVVYFGPTDPDNTAAAAVYCDRGAIVNCHITADFDTANGAAIYAVGGTDTEPGLISHNVIICGPTQRAKYGIYLEGDGWTVVGNPKIYKALLDGIHVPSTGSEHVIVGNSIIIPGRDGVRVDGTAGLCLITGNIIDTPGVNGIHLTANTTDNVIGTNLVIGAGGVDILDDGTNTVNTDQVVSPLTTKGDVFGYDTDDARIPIGTNDQVLTADSAQALGVKWATGVAGPDADAIHDNVAAEISAIASKATPIDDDFLLIEDSAAGDAKKKITIGDLPGGGGNTIVPAFGETYKHDVMSGSAFAWKGTSVVPSLDTKVYALVHFGDVISGATYQAAVITVSGGTIATISKTGAVTATAAQAQLIRGRLTFLFATPIDLTADSTYYLVIGRTDSTDTYAFGVGFAGITYPFFFGPTGSNEGIRIAKANPAVSDAVELVADTTTMGAYVVQDGLSFTP